MASSSIGPENTRGVVLLIGAPGVRKTCLGKAMVAQQAAKGGSGGAPLFFSVSERLRDEGMLAKHVAPDERAAWAETMRATARDLLSRQLRTLGQRWAVKAGARDHTSTRSKRQVLVLEAVKDMEGADDLAELLEQHDVPLLQVGKSSLPRLPDSEADTGAGRLGREIHEVAERQAKWQRAAGWLLELYSSLGCLAEVSLLDMEDGATQQPSLAALGYAAPAPACSWLEAAGWAPRGRWKKSSSDTSSGSNWSGISDISLQQTWPDLAITPLQPVTSCRLVSCSRARAAVVAEAEAFTGLHPLPLPVPSRSVTCSADARWLAYPGRYLAALKADGVRHLLITTATGQPFLLNRAGALYAYPMQTAPSQPAAATGQEGALSGRAELEGEEQEGQQAATLPPAAPPPCGLPCRTVLDGELVLHGGGAQPLFLVFDALCVAGSPVWQLPLTARLQHLDSLGLTTASEAVTGQAAASVFTPLPALKVSVAVPLPAATAGVPPPGFVKQQQGPPTGQDTVLVLRKPCFPVSPSGLLQLQAAAKHCGFPADGVVFSPCAMSCVLGQAELLIKWQPPGCVGVDVMGKSLEALERLTYRICLPWSDLVRAVEHQQQQQQQQTARPPSALHSPTLQSSPVPPNPDLVPAALTSPHPARLLPFSQLYALALAAVQCGSVEVSSDPDTGLQVFNYLAAASPGSSQAEQLCRGLVLHQHSQTLVATPFPRFAAERQLDSPPCTVTRAAATAVAPPPPAGQPSSPAAAAVRAAVKVDGSLIIAFLWQGQVHACTRRRMTSEQAVWAQGQLRANPAFVAHAQPGWTYLFEAVYAANTHIISYPFQGLAEQLCRGLVLHPDSHTLVATPFPRFAAEQQLDSPHVPSSVPREAATALAPPPAGQPSSVRAAVKVDGSLVIAFLWQGQVHACTRHCLTSEQAVWAQGQLRANPDFVAHVQPGWTYLFEAVYAANTHVISYPFQGLVLLDAICPAGLGLASGAAKHALATRLGTLAAPELQLQETEELGSWLQAGQASSPSTPTPIPPPTPTYPPASEGWVVTLGSCGQRIKLVNDSFKRAHYEAQLLHPLCVWDRVRQGASRDQLLPPCLPSHLRAEAEAVLAALHHSFQEVWLHHRAKQQAVAAQEHGGLGEQPLSMYYSKQQDFLSEVVTTPHLRAQLLGFVRPALDGSGLPGYQPSPAMAQTPGQRGR
ncbi:hypothetical protein V8C86DRAFT_1827786 [Haematococcus lacustris]